MTQFFTFALDLQGSVGQPGPPGPPGLPGEGIQGPKVGNETEN